MLQGQGHPRKMDKSTILQRTIDFLQKQKGRKMRHIYSQFVKVIS